MFTKVRLTVKRLTTYYKTRCPVELAVARGYEIVYSSTLPVSIVAMFVPVGKRGTIIVNNQYPDFKYPYVIGHEMGHGVFQHEGERFTLKRDLYRLDWKRLCLQEKEAHLFSACLMLDNLTFEDGMTIEQAAALSGCPPDIIKIWLHEKRKAG